MSAARGQISPQAIERATGKPWSRWSRLLRRFNVKQHGHTAAARFLRTDHGVGMWWAQMLVVQYEQEAGLRQPRQRADRSYVVRVQRTIRATRDQAWRAWTDADRARLWLAGLRRLEARVDGALGPIAGGMARYTELAPQKRLRLEWTPAKAHARGADAGRIEVLFAALRPGRVAVSVEHMRISSKRDADQLKLRWSRALDALKATLEAAGGADSA